MFILVSGATRTMRRLVGHPNLGVLLTPHDGNVAPAVGVVWAADNGAFRGYDDVIFRAFLKRIEGRHDCRFVCARDVVGDAAETMLHWPKSSDLIREHGLKPAFVAQDGCMVEDVPWSDIGGLGAVFIGGTTRYKLSEEAARIAGEARRRNVWRHMGRVNTARRILYAAALQMDSIDGSSFSRFPDTHLGWALRTARQQPLPMELLPS